PRIGKAWIRPSAAQAGYARNRSCPGPPALLVWDPPACSPTSPVEAWAAPTGTCPHNDGWREDHRLARIRGCRDIRRDLLRYTSRGDREEAAAGQIPFSRRSSGRHEWRRPEAR